MVNLLRHAYVWVAKTIKTSTSGILCDCNLAEIRSKKTDAKHITSPTTEIQNQDAPDYLTENALREADA